MGWDRKVKEERGEGEDGEDGKGRRNEDIGRKARGYYGKVKARKKGEGKGR